jgi:hypothetical protein
VWFVETARKLWFRRDAWIHEGIFSHPNELMRANSAYIDEFHAAQWVEATPAEAVATFYGVSLCQALSRK